MNTKLNWKDVEAVSRFEKQFLSTNLCMSLAQELDLISLRSPYRLTDTYPKTLENIVHSSRLDYGNALCYGLLSIWLIDFNSYKIQQPVLLPCLESSNILFRYFQYASGLLKYCNDF